MKENNNKETTEITKTNRTIKVEVPGDKPTPLQIIVISAIILAILGASAALVIWSMKQKDAPTNSLPVSSIAASSVPTASEVSSIPAVSSEVEPTWTEEKFEKTLWAKQKCTSRAKPLEDEYFEYMIVDVVEWYQLDDAVKVVAKTDTGYYKMKDGEFLQQRFLTDVDPAVTAKKKAEEEKAKAAAEKAKADKLEKATDTKAEQNTDKDAKPAATKPAKPAAKPEKPATKDPAASKMPVPNPKYAHKPNRVSPTFEVDTSVVGLEGAHHGDTKEDTNLSGNIITVHYHAGLNMWLEECYWFEERFGQHMEATEADFEFSDAHQYSPFQQDGDYKPLKGCFDPNIVGAYFCAKCESWVTNDGWENGQHGDAEVKGYTNKALAEKNK